MKSRNLLLTTGLIAAVFGLFGIVLASSLLPGNATAAGLFTSHLAGSGAHRWGHGHSGCALDERTSRLVEAYVSISLDLDDTQERALAPVLLVLENWQDSAGSFCEHPAIESAPAALRAAQVLLEETRSAMSELVPAFDAFYAALTVEQQTRLNSWLQAHHSSPSNEPAT